MKSVAIYGPGCKRCAATAQMVEAAAAKLGIEVGIEKVTNARAIAMAGVLATPGIAIDGHLVHAGGLPDEARLEDWLSS
ncbi:thioredoxin family protein [Poseidonocella sp. HB161398]|uniref:thioredoxin family protein n=1 Tax=Poseidonocella sp. HB161398 TaxID=2320855 RepID=UPI001107FC83|nr:thioredoxin family protein [Poseidonocella sp. HB161398]